MSLVTGHTRIEIPTLAAGRIVMRAPRTSDFEAYADYCASDRSRGVGGPYDRMQAESRFLSLVGQWHHRGYGRWIVTADGSDAPLGLVGLFYPEGWPAPEIAWTVFAGAEGRGIAYEAALMARRYAYEVLGWSTAVSCVMPGNARSIALARRMGAVDEGRFAHPRAAELIVFRHPSPEALAAEKASEKARAVQTGDAA